MNYYLPTSPDNKQKIRELFNELSTNPFVDMKTKFYFPARPVMFTICKVEGWWIIYYRPQPSMIHIVNVGRVSERPGIRRP